MLRRFLEYYGPPFLAVNRASTRASPARRVIPWRSAHSSKGIKYLRVRPKRSRSSAGVACPSSEGLQRHPWIERMLLVVAPENLCEARRLSRHGSPRDDCVGQAYEVLARLGDDAGHTRRGQTEPYGKARHREPSEPGLARQLAQPLYRWLLRREPPLAQPRPLRREGVEHDAAADRRHGRKRPQHKPVTAAGDERCLEHQARETLFARCDRSHLDHACQHLGCAEVHAEPGTGGDRLVRGGDQRTRLRSSRSTTSACTRSSHSGSARSRLVMTGMPRRTPSSSTIARCSSVCGMIPSSAATTSRATSMPVAPASMLRTKPSWPGTSTTLAWSWSPSGSGANPRSIVIPRRFSSSHRSVSTPVRAFTSAVLPWSMWPAVPTTKRRREPEWRAWGSRRDAPRSRGRRGHRSRRSGDGRTERRGGGGRRHAARRAVAGPLERRSERGGPGRPAAAAGREVGSVCSSSRRRPRRPR